MNNFRFRRLSNKTLAACAVAAIAGLTMVRADTVISNLGQSLDDSQAVGGAIAGGVNSPIWAQPFTTGTGNYLNFNSVTLDFGPYGPSGVTTPDAPISITLYSGSFDSVQGGYLPDQALLTLTPTNSFPDSAGSSTSYTFSASDGLVLAVNSTYLIVLSSTNTNDAYYTSILTSSASFDSAPLDGWTVTGSPVSAYYDITGAGWSVFSGESLRFSVSASVVPEPSAFALGGIGVAALGVLLLRRKRVGA